jgi:hypothetical protein
MTNFCQAISSNGWPANAPFAVAQDRREEVYGPRRGDVIEAQAALGTYSQIAQMPLAGHAQQAPGDDLARHNGPGVDLHRIGYAGRFGFSSRHRIPPSGPLKRGSKRSWGGPEEAPHNPAGLRGKPCPASFSL